MKKTSSVLLLFIVLSTAVISWVMVQNLISNGQPSGEDMAMFEKEYGAKPYIGKKVVLTKEEWKKRLTPEEFYVMREGGTEKAFTGDLYDNKEKGTYVCAACDLSLFSSESKFDSKTGWPSFWEPINPSHVGYKIDRGLFFTERIEVHCNRCDSHLGHVFNDGPPPTGHRYCINSVALKFIKE